MMSEFVRRIIVSRSKDLTPWSWDACEQRVKKIIAADDISAANTFWKKLGDTMHPDEKRTRQEEAILQENHARISVMWDRLGGPEWQRKHDDREDCHITEIRHRCGECPAVGGGCCCYGNVGYAFEENTATTTTAAKYAFEDTVSIDEQYAF